MGLAPRDTDMTDAAHGEFECEACEKQFDSRAALERHLRDVGLVD